jgi:parvulin-like peptidyl-prolyl isomerase
LFTEPAKQRVSLILLKVDPSSAQAVWDQAMEKGKAIVGRLDKGADFAEVARLHSGDQSAASGGDMGYMHRGAIAEHVAQWLDKLALNQVSEPLQILEGIGIFKVTERVAPQLHPLLKVRDRAVQLWRREQSELAWKGLIDRLRAAAAIKVHDASRYPELASTAAPASTAR